MAFVEAVSGVYRFPKKQSATERLGLVINTDQMAVMDHASQAELDKPSVQESPFSGQSQIGLAGVAAGVVVDADMRSGRPDEGKEFGRRKQQLKVGIDASFLF